MKTITLPLCALIIASGFIVGCATKGYKKAADTASALTKSSELIAKGNTVIDASLANLNDLVSNPQPDLRKQFKAFNSSVNDLDATDREIASEIQKIKSQGAAYFEKWDQEIARMQNEDIRNRSETRKHEVAGRFGRISRHYDEAQTAFGPFRSALHDVQKFLSTDLTSGGLSAIKEFVKKANTDAVPLKQSLADLSDEFKGLGRSVSPTTSAR